MRSLASLVLLGLSALCGGAHALLKADPDVKTVAPVPNESKSAAPPSCPVVDIKQSNPCQQQQQQMVMMKPDRS